MKNTLIVIIILVVGLTAGYLIKGKTLDIASNTKSNTEDQAMNEPTDKINNSLTLNLSNQSLTKTPDYVFNRTNLVELNLSNNSLGGALQSQINNLKSLKVLNLSNNNFTGVPAEIGQLKNLEILNLSNNQITGLPNELGSLSKLKVLDLTGNNYSAQDLEKIKTTLPATTIIKTD